jgi:hypothetical protein
MRPSVLAACLTLLLLAWPAAAQVAPTQPADAPANGSGTWVIMDLVLWTVPGPVDETCIQLPPGRLAITARLEDVGQPQPVRYQFSPYWYRAADSPSAINAQVTPDPRTFEAMLAGGRYCYAIVNEGAMPSDSENGESTGQAQLVAVKMTLTPQ